MENSNLTKGPIKEQLTRLAIPASIGFFFNTLFNVVDTYYAGKISTDALAGMTISFPIFFIVIALSSGIGAGVNALSSIALGKNNNKLYHALAINGAFLAGIMSLILMVFSPILSKYLFVLSGAEGEAMRLGVRYVQTIFLGTSLFIFNYLLNGLLTSQGNTKAYRNFLIGGFFLNLILDPLFIYGWFGLPELDTMGVAIATLIVQGLGTIYLIYKVYVSEVFNLKLFKSCHINKEVMWDILKQGIPSSLNMATVAIGVFVINFYILRYGDEATIAGYGAAVRVEQLVLLPAMGFNIAVLSMTGQAFGAEMKERILSIHKKAIIITSIIMIVGAFLVYPFANNLVALFNSKEDVVKAGTSYLRIEVFAFVTYVILSVSVASLQGIKRPNYAIYIGLYRQIVMPMIVFYLLGGVLGLGVQGVFWGIVVINWSSVVVTWWYHQRTMNQIEF
jgi:putative MATE family efflux protein